MSKLKKHRIHLNHDKKSIQIDNGFERDSDGWFALTEPVNKQSARTLDIWTAAGGRHIQLNAWQIKDLRNFLELAEVYKNSTIIRDGKTYHVELPD